MDIPIYRPYLNDDTALYVERAVRSMWISSQGEYLTQFENMLADYFDVKYVVLTNSGTAACHLALLANDIRPYDEVIVPDITFAATASVVKHVEAYPTLVDVDENTWNMSVEAVEHAITDKTKAIFCVHLLGMPCNIRALKHLAWKYNLRLIEDACEAFGVEYEGYKLGTYGECGIFSFFGNKTITTGEGGALITNDKRIYEQAMLYRGQGQTERYFHPVAGFNYRMTNLQAAIGCSQLKHINDVLIQKERVTRCYQYANLTYQFPSQPLNPVRGRWMYAVRVPDAKHVQQHLINNGIDSRCMFQPLHTMPTFAGTIHMPKHGIEPFSKTLAKEAIMLPSYPALQDKTIHYIMKEVGQAVQW